MVTMGSILSGTFRFIGNNIRALLVWSAILFLFSLVMMAMMRPFYEAQIAMLQQEAGTGPALPPMGAFLLAMLLGVVVFVVLAAAAFRAVLFPEQSRFAYLRLGMDELRLLGCVLILLVGFYLLMIVAAIAGAMMMALVASSRGGSAIFLLLVGAAMIVLGAWLATRLALAGPLTILRRKIVIGPAWRLTRGHFWQLLGAYIAIMLILFVAYAAIFLIRMGPAMTDMFHPTDQAAALRVATAQVSAYTLSLKTIVVVLVTSLIMGFAHALYAGSVAVATAQLLDRGGGQRLSEVFE